MRLFNRLLTPPIVDAGLMFLAGVCIADLAAICRTSPLAWILVAVGLACFAVSLVIFKRILFRRRPSDPPARSAADRH